VKNIVDSHSQSFFGQSTGMFIQSSSKSEPFIFLKFIKKKGNNSWEKLSTGEGKTIKCGLEEIIMILEVLRKNSKSWSTVHRFKEDKTPISVSWEGENKVWFNVGDYPKMLNFAQIEILKMLLIHILSEKIEFATVSTTFKRNNSVKQIDNTNEPKEDNLAIIEEVNAGNDIGKIEGYITSETEKALLMKLKDGNEYWIPKSIIKSDYTSEKDVEQAFYIDSWFLEKNSINKSLDLEVA
jgi:hypothetical protein